MNKEECRGLPVVGGTVVPGDIVEVVQFGGEVLGSSLSGLKGEGTKYLVDFSEDGSGRVALDATGCVWLVEPGHYSKCTASQSVCVSPLCVKLVEKAAPPRYEAESSPSAPGAFDVVCVDALGRKVVVARFTNKHSFAEAAANREAARLNGEGRLEGDAD